RPVIEMSELLVAELLIETGRLKAEGVEPSEVTAAVARPGFGLDHQLAADTATAQTLRDPKIFDEQPPAISLAGETRNDPFPIPDKAEWWSRATGPKNSSARSTRWCWRHRPTSTT